MKNLKKSILAVLLAGTFGFAKAGTANEMLGEKLRTTISKSMSLPQELKKEKMNEKLSVQFSLSKEGELKVVKVESTNKELKKFVKETLEKIKIDVDNDSKEEKTFSIDLVFKVK
jgi:hypothetical protein